MSKIREAAAALLARVKADERDRVKDCADAGSATGHGYEKSHRCYNSAADLIRKAGAALAAEEGRERVTPLDDAETEVAMLTAEIAALRARLDAFVTAGEYDKGRAVPASDDAHDVWSQITDKPHRALLYIDDALAALRAERDALRDCGTSHESACKATSGACIACLTENVDGLRSYLDAARAEVERLKESEVFWHAAGVKWEREALADIERLTRERDALNQQAANDRNRARHNGQARVAAESERDAAREELEQYRMRLAGALTTVEGHALDVQDDPRTLGYLRTCPTIAACVRVRRELDAARAGEAKARGDLNEVGNGLVRAEREVERLREGLARIQKDGVNDSSN